MIDAAGVERAAAADDPVNNIAFSQQQFGQIRAVLAGDAGDQSGFSDSGLQVQYAIDGFTGYCWTSILEFPVQSAEERHKTLSC